MKTLEIGDRQTQNRAEIMIFSDKDPENSVTVEVVESDDNQALAATVILTDDEERDRLHLERKVERAFYKAGKALNEIRDRKLYRTQYKTFEAYVKERFCMKQSRSYQLMDAAIVVDNLLPKIPPLVEVNDNSNKVLPTSERPSQTLTIS